MDQAISPPSCSSRPVSQTRGSTTQSYKGSSQNNDSDSNIDRELPGLVERHRHDAGSDNDSSDESYVYRGNEQKQIYHTDNDNSSIKDSVSEGDNGLPGLQEKKHEDASSEDDSDYNQGDDAPGPRASKNDKEYRLGDSNNKQEDQHQFFPTNTNIIPATNKWQDDDDDGDKYDGNNDDDDEDDMPRLPTRYLAATLRL